MLGTISYANLMSTLAVFIALGGTSYAIARNSVGERELKDGAVTSSRDLTFVTQSGATPSAGRVDVHSTGQLRWVRGSTDEPDFTSLDTIAFWTD